jgi:ATP-dependent Clp endopeptidase proteolytic subunit ClpP
MANPRNKSWFRMEKKSEELAEITIMDEIDSWWGLGPKEFKLQLDEIKEAKTIKLSINSPGGSVFDGMAIRNMLAAVGDKLDVEVIGLAASIASIIALAGRSLKIAEGAYLMIHNPWSFAAGDAVDLRKTADVLDMMKTDFVAIYGKKTGLTDDEISDMMDAETWMSSADAVDKGFADGEVDYGKVAACASPAILAKFKNTPEPIKSAAELKMIDNPRDLENLLRDSGRLSKAAAVAIVADGWKAVARSDSGADQRGEPAVKPAISKALLIQEIEANEKLKRLV